MLMIDEEHSDDEPHIAKASVTRAVLVQTTWGMDIWGGAAGSTSWQRDVTEHGMELVKEGMDLPSYEMSHDAWNHTIDMINKLPLSKVQTVRYIHIGFGCLSGALALMVVGRVWYDSWRAHLLAAKRQSR